MKYTEELLNKESIYTLRNIGRKLGVKSPTKQIKPQLIKSIIAVANGEIKPYSTKKGRPAIKSEISYGNINSEENKEEINPELLHLIRKIVKEEIAKLLIEISNKLSID